MKKNANTMPSEQAQQVGILREVTHRGVFFVHNLVTALSAVAKMVPEMSPERGNRWKRYSFDRIASVQLAWVVISLPVVEPVVVRAEALPTTVVC